jgi:hypothetical protein
MKARQNALKLLEEFKIWHDEKGFSVEDVVRATALQGMIFEKLNPELWDAAVKDAREGVKLAVPEREN